MRKTIQTKSGAARWKVAAQSSLRSRAPAIRIQHIARTTGKILSELESKLPRAQRLPRSVYQVSLFLIGDRAMRRLNRLYRGKDRPTDVLSFSQIEGDLLLAPEILGDIVISLDTAQRQARRYGVTLKRETLRLLVHGLLHLCGYDHENVPPAKVREMQRMEDYLFARHVRACDGW
jgi:probable rRNA maturation factor